MRTVKQRQKWSNEPTGQNRFKLRAERTTVQPISNFKLVMAPKLEFPTDLKSFFRFFAAECTIKEQMLFFKRKYNHIAR